MNLDVEQKRIFQRQDTKKWWTGGSWSDSKEDAFKFPTSVCPIDFRFNHEDTPVIFETVETNNTLQ